MKLFRLIACVIVLCSMATLNSCQKDDIDQARSVSPISHKGGLAFHVVDGERQEVEGITISIARSEFDLHHGTYIATQISDIKGRADFGLLNRGEYFFKAEGLVEGVRIYREGPVVVQAGRNRSVDITMK